MTDKIRAPWTPEQVDALNRFQQYGGMHPFTCGNDHGSMNVVLMAHQDGWHCSAPACDYRQDWAHAFMADPDAWPKGLRFASVINPQTGLGMATGGNMSRTNLLEAALAAQLGRPLYDTINQHLADGERAEAAIARVRALAERLNDELASDADKTYARAILTALDQPAPAAATQATDDQERRISDTDLLAWTVVLERRRQQQRDGITVLLLPFPPCPTCQQAVHEAETVMRIDRFGQLLTTRPCNHVHSIDDMAMQRIYHHARNMLGVLGAAAKQPAGGKAWNTHRIITEAKARVEKPDA